MIPNPPANGHSGLDEEGEELGPANTLKRIEPALFEHAEVLGPTKVRLHSSDEAVARGWATVTSGGLTTE